MPDELTVPAPGAEHASGAEDTALFKGERFKLNPDISEWALLEFAEAADGGLDGDSLEGMAALMRFVIELVAPDDRDRFRKIARKHRATATDLFDFLAQEVEDDAERPTVPPVGSSDGPESIGPKPAPNSDGKASRTAGRRPLDGRPDLQLMVDAARKSA